MSLDKFKNTLTEMIKSKIPVQTAWVICKSVDWNTKTMIAEGIVDGLDYFDVLLGLNALQIQPEINSKCLIGLLGNNSAAAFLIWCNDAELIQFNKGELKGLPISDHVVDRLNIVEKDLNDLKQVFTSWVVAPQDGGAALKSAAGTWFGNTITETQYADIANEKITQ